MNFRSFLFLSLAILALGCSGYSVRSSENPPLAKLGIRTLYISPFINNTYRAGVETIAYNSVIKAIRQEGGLRIVSDAKSADAILTGTVTDALSTPGTIITVDQIRTSAQTQVGYPAPNDVRVASTYNATLGAFFLLERTRPPSPKIPAHIWSSNFSRSKPYSASTQLGVLGNTSSLINDSELTHALSDLSDQMASDVYQSMTSLF